MQGETDHPADSVIKLYIYEKCSGDMNILITLPKHLIDKILSGQKRFEMRMCLPRNMRLGVDGFFVVEKGSDKVVCWCRVDVVYGTYIDHYNADWFASRLCVSYEYIEKYTNGKQVWLWKISKVIKLQDLSRCALMIDKNPQQFVYCPLSYGESF